MVITNFFDKTTKECFSPSIYKLGETYSRTIFYRPVSTSVDLLKHLKSLDKIGEDILKNIVKTEQTDAMQPAPWHPVLKRKSNQLKKIKCCIEKIFQFIKNRLRPFLGIGNAFYATQNLSDLKNLVCELKSGKSPDFLKILKQEGNSFSRQEHLALIMGEQRLHKGLKKAIVQVRKLSDNFQTARKSCDPLDYRAQALFDKRFKTTQKILNLIEKRLASFDAQLEISFKLDESEKVVERKS